MTVTGNGCCRQVKYTVKNSTLRNQKSDSYREVAVVERLHAQ